MTQSQAIRNLAQAERRLRQYRRSDQFRSAMRRLGKLAQERRDALDDFMVAVARDTVDSILSPRRRRLRVVNQ